ncbi:coproporphyrinogen III oxidase [Paenibacillus sp. FSL R7-0273]|uniref:STM4012 family radical SAM protein n=1 Tax=Paenibacillus sp. FSL R7-0273 TaxID=1536772 RepID=UPI0004F70896|nr:STM4012 family radical SAM protein [Paenibacillus sp. FSL R7-0273]AIQ45338.1 coproporphyrinogen III oxidase [Paenibacillus sp. FSL R7-0273]OMF90036.1 coproporphyrinogen III oxidase [Paenibacillus sp. FSL R7-0273]
MTSTDYGLTPSLSSEEARRWKEQITAQPYRNYLYSYPHKTAYREFQPPVSLEQLWLNEPAETFFLYMHIPFCGARCGFCNLFTLPDKRDDVHERYVDALERQARQWSAFTGHKPFARFAVGGGTPTLLAAPQLSRLFRIAREIMGLDTSRASISVETSPETITEEKLSILKENTVDRVSMGIQSFVAAESAAIYRPQNPEVVYRALELLGQYDFPILNLDLIYGLPGQTVESWLYSLGQALLHEPQEIFIYPLYTREHTIVKPGDMQRQQDLRHECYTAACRLLAGHGYRQYSMRRFAKEEAGTDKSILDYSCQEEGMVGLGCGARSYTRELHYASRYGVSRKATESIIADYVSAERYDTADYGIMLSLAEQKRRFILKALLHSEGLRLADYSGRFSASLWDDHPELTLLLESGLGELQYDEQNVIHDGDQDEERQDERLEGLYSTKAKTREAGQDDWLGGRDGILRLTPEGLGYSDSIGDWFISGDIRDRMEGFILP